MKSTAHAAISLVVAALAILLTAPPFPAWAVAGVALLVGVGVDVDHFLLARRRGDWDAVRRCLGDPRIVLVEQGAIFEDGEVGAVERLLSHVVIGGVAVPLCWWWSPYLAGLVAAALYGHVLADLVATTRETVVLDADAVPATGGTGADAVATGDSAGDGSATRADGTDGSTVDGSAAGGSATDAVRADGDSRGRDGADRRDAEE